MSQGVFQSKIDQNFEGCPGVIGISDDIVMYVFTEEEHNKNLHGVMNYVQIQPRENCCQTG